jgi:DNA transposition AAA+ family ATPase
MRYVLCMIIEKIRKHIETCGKTRYRIWQESGVSEAQLCRIMKGKTCTVETADILLRYFGLIIADKKRNRKAR